jgi:hypothetical protein
VLTAHPGRTAKVNPKPAQFISRSLPVCSVIRPSSVQAGGAVATIESFTADLLFHGQSQEFFDTVMDLACAADAARRAL